MYVYIYIYIYNIVLGLTPQCLGLIRATHTYGLGLTLTLNCGKRWQSCALQAWGTETVPVRGAAGGAAGGAARGARSPSSGRRARCGRRVRSALTRHDETPNKAAGKGARAPHGV